MSGFMRFTETDFGSKGRAIKATEDFPKKLTSECRWRLKVWWFIVWQEARTLCMGWAYDTGTLHDTIRIEEDKPMPEGYPFEVSFASQNKILTSMIVAGGILINPKTGRIVDYAQAVHDGHFTVSGKWVPPRPFLEIAIELHRPELDAILKICMETTEREVWAGE